MRRLISAAQWYFEIKNLSLKNIFHIRCPLSVESQHDLRLYYSQYFSSLLSAIELILEQKEPESSIFRENLYQGLSFNEFADGEQNYSYIRELRNSIIHRGLDVTSSAHINEDFPMMIAPSPIKNRGGNKSYQPFGFYLIELIQKCEEVIGGLILNFFKENGYFDLKNDTDKLRNEIKEFLVNSDHRIMPKEVKAMALLNIDSLELNAEQLHRDFIESVSKVLRKNVLSEYFDFNDRTR